MHVNALVAQFILDMMEVRIRWARNAEEVIDSVRYAVLSDRRLRLRGEDKPMARDRVLQLSKMVADAYLGAPEMGYGVNGEDEGSPS